MREGIHQNCANHRQRLTVLVGLRLRTNALSPETQPLTLRTNENSSPGLKAAKELREYMSTSLLQM